MSVRHQPPGLVVHADTLPTVRGEIRPASSEGVAITRLRQQPPRSLGMVIKERRRELGWSQEALAAQVVAHGDRAFGQSEVSRLERGKIGLPHRERLSHIAAALGLSLGELLARSGWAGATAAFVPQAPPMAAPTATPGGAAVPGAVPGEGPPPVPLPVATPPVPGERHDLQRVHGVLAEARATRAHTHQVLARSQMLVDYCRGLAASAQDRTARRGPALPEQPRLPYPRYRVEEHVLDQAAFIVGFADTWLQYESHLACRAAQLRRTRITADLVVIDQDTETLILQAAV